MDVNTLLETIQGCQIATYHGKNGRQVVHFIDRIAQDEVVLGMDDTGNVTDVLHTGGPYPDGYEIDIRIQLFLEGARYGGG